MKTYLAKYISEWEEGGNVETNVQIDLNTGLLEIDSSDADVDGLIREYVLFQDEEYYIDKEYLEYHGYSKLEDGELNKLRNIVGYSK